MTQAPAAASRLAAARAGLVYLIGNLASSAVPFLLLPVLTRWLSPAEYGQVVNFSVLMAASGALAGLSAHGAVGVEWFKRTGEDRARFVGSAVVLVLASGAACGSLLAGTAALAGQARVGFGPGVAALAVLAATANVLLAIRLAAWQSDGLAVRHSVLLVSTSATNVLLSLAAVGLFAWGGAGRMAGIAAAFVLAAAFSVASLLRAGQMRVGLRRADVAGLLAFGVPLAPHVLAAVVLVNVDRFVVGAVLGPGPLGPYGAAAQLAAVMGIASDAFVKAFNPWLYEQLQSGSAEARRRVVRTVYAAMPAFVALAAVLLTVLLAAGPWLLGPAYRSALELLPWFVAGGACSGIYLAVSGLFFFEGRTGRLASVTVSAALTGTLANLVLVPRFGVHGAGAAFLVAQAVMATAAFALALRSFDLPWRRP